MIHKRPISRESQSFVGYCKQQLERGSIPSAHHCDGEVIQDHEGGEFADLEFAVREAVRSVQSLVSGDVLAGVRQLDLSIQVCDAGDKALHMVLFKDVITVRGAKGR